MSVEIVAGAWAAVCLLACAASFGLAFRGYREQQSVEPAPVARPAVPRPAPVAPTPVTAPRPEPARPVRVVPDLRSRLEKTRSALVGRIEGLLRSKPTLDPELYEELEAILFGADLGVRTAEQLLEAARAAGSPDAVRGAIEARALELLGGAAPPVDRGAARPHVILIVGVNGSGKTTTIGKLAARFAAEGQSVLIGAGDTFRAAAIEQLEIWAERSGAGFVKGEPGGDAAAVAFDAVKAALTRELDVVLIDTAGRLQTDAGLMQELAKISRVVARDVPGAPHEVLLVIDANTGQNGIRQAQEFKRAVGVSGIVLTKLDGTAKGGVVVGIAQEVELPVRFIGVGESVDDLIDFEPEAFVRALFAP
jgi:fused signal recognition particle receptor